MSSPVYADSPLARARSALAVARGVPGADLAALDRAVREAEDDVARAARARAVERWWDWDATQPLLAGDDDEPATATGAASSLAAAVDSAREVLGHEHEPLHVEVSLTERPHAPSRDVGTAEVTWSAGDAAWCWTADLAGADEVAAGDAHHAEDVVAEAVAFVLRTAGLDHPTLPGTRSAAQPSGSVADRPAPPSPGAPAPAPVGVNHAP